MTGTSPDMNQYVREAYDNVAVAYLRHRRDDCHDLPYLDRLADDLEPGDRILDVGCGAGLPIAAHLVDHGFEVIGIDISAVQIDLARQNVPGAQFLQRDMNELEEEEFEVAAIVAFYSLFHTPRLGHRRLLQILRTYLQVGGRLLCTFGSTEWEGEEPFFGVPMRWSHFGPEPSIRLVAAAGFDVESAEFVEHAFEDEVERHLMVVAHAS